MKLFKRFIILTFLMCAFLTDAFVTAQEPFYQKKDSWAETLLASRERYSVWRTRQMKGVHPEPWHMTVPASTNRDVFKTEKSASLAIIDFKAKDGKGKRLWEARPDLLDGMVHYDLSNHGISVNRVVPQKGTAISAKLTTRDLLPPPARETPASGPFIYQARVIRADKAKTITAWVGAQNGLEGWLNGENIFREPNLGNGLFPKAEQGRIHLRLKAGENFLVLRFLGSYWDGFYFSTLPYGQTHPDPVKGILERLGRDFPAATYRMRADALHEEIVSWFRSPTDARFPEFLLKEAEQDLGESKLALRAELRKRGTKLSEPRASSSPTAIQNLGLYEKTALVRNARSDLEMVDFAALKRTIVDLSKSFPDTYTRGEDFLERLHSFERRLPAIHEALDGEFDAKVKNLSPQLLTALREVKSILDFQRLVLLSNPLLNFDKLLLIKRATLGDPRRAEAPNRGMGEFLGLPQQSSWQLDRIRQPYGWDNEIALMKMPRAPSLKSSKKPELETLYRPPVPKLISDIDLHFNCDKMLLSMPGSDFLWHVFEMDAEGRTARQLTPDDAPNVHYYDACYLPNGKIVFISTAPFQGVPCSNGIVVGMAYSMDADGRNIQQLCFDQDHDYAPNVMNDGRILYLRWDYTDLPHQWPRILFTMNPDGSGQREYYGSGSYWPNAIFYARPVPNHQTMIAGIVTGHHVGRVGELILFDPALGRHEASGVVQRIPGYGQKVEPIVIDKLAINSWPKFVHPFPLSEKYLIVSCKPRPGDLWGIYLVDVFDNILLLKETEGYGLFEPLPFRKRETPPIIADRVDHTKKDALLYVENVYEGPGLKGVPHGSVKQLRLFTYHFAYQYKSGGQHRVGTDGPWEPKRVLGTVPVEADGSAFFRVPAKTPISIQPLDAEGKALQLMRSWTTAMPGESVSCVGCHENQNATPSGRPTLASKRQASEIQPWHGPVRGFSFKNEVQPVLDRHCVGCHDGGVKHGKKMIDLRTKEDEFIVIASKDPTPVRVRGVSKTELMRKYSGVFEPSYVELRRLVRTGGLESDLHLQKPGEFHADTTELVQMLKKGHHGVQLDGEAWERLTTWIDLNAPCHATWADVIGKDKIYPDYARRLALHKRYADLDADFEAPYEAPPEKIIPLKPKRRMPRKIESPALLNLPDWPLDRKKAQSRQSAAGKEIKKVLDLGNGVSMEFALVPSGSFVMGEAKGEDDEFPPTPLRIEKSFWIGKFEVTNEQFALFDPAHDSRFEHGAASAASKRARGPVLNEPKQPVVRISWCDAMAFCDWLTGRANGPRVTLRATLPTEAQWEYACRAGTDGDFFFGDLDDDFSPFANMADATIGKLATWSEKRRCADITPRDERYNDGALVTAEVGRFKPNAWGLHDVHGNVWEWTRSEYRPYPYEDGDGRNAIVATPSVRRAVRGGSWYDRPKRCRSSFRLSYPAWQSVYNVGFRVILELEKNGSKVAKGQ